MAPAHPALDLGPDRQATVAKAMLRAADLLGLTARDLSAVIGVSEATLSRLKHGQGVAGLSGKAYELALLFVRLYRSLDAIRARRRAGRAHPLHRRAGPCPCLSGRPPRYALRRASAPARAGGWSRRSTASRP